MKGKKLGVLLAALAAVIVLVVVAVFAMGGNNKPNKDTEKEPNKNTEQSTEDTDELKPVVLTDKALEGDFLLDFANGPDSSVVFESDGWSNGDVFNVVWTKNNVKYADGKMYLGITKENKTAWLNDVEVPFQYTAGEARTQNYFGYGDYFVKMKPSANPGTASTFFTCTGPYDSKYVLDENGAAMLNEDGTIKMEPNPHDEIDIEFLGKDTTKVQFNFFVNGVGGNEYMYDLGFDASKEFHEYGFRWTEDSITWFIDGKPVYKVTTDKTVEPAENVRIVEVLPKTPGRLLMNYWCGNEDAEGWMGKYEGNVNDNGCEYQWIKTSTKGAPLNPDNVDLSAAENCLIVNGENYLFTTDANYTFNALNDNKALNITYKNIEGATYANIATGLADLPSKYNKLTMKVKNNGKQAVKIRIDVQSQTQVSANTKACNIYATQDGNEVYTDKDWGGSQFEIAAGKTSTLEIYFDASKKTEALIIYIDSADYLEDGKGIKHSGDITFSNVAFGTGKVPVAQAPVVPDVDTSKLDRVEADLTFTGHSQFNIAKDEEANTIRVTYSNIPGETYEAVKAGVEPLDPGLNRFSVKVTNNGEKKLAFRIDIIGGIEMGKDGNGKPMMVCNLTALQDGKVVDGATDLLWGGSKFEIEPGKTSVLEVVFDATKDVKEVGFFLDTHIYQDTVSPDSTIKNTHSGDVVLSEMAFLGELKGEVDGPIQTPGYGDDAPEHPVSGNLETTINGMDLDITGATSDGYGVNARLDEDDEPVIDVKYTNVIGNSWKTVKFEGIGNLATAHNTFKVEITNNGTETVKVRIDLKNANDEFCNIDAVETAVRAATDNTNGTQVELVAGATAIVEIQYDPTKNPVNVIFFFDSWIWNDSTPHAGDITLSGVEFTTKEYEPSVEVDKTLEVNGEELTFNQTVYNISADDDERTLNVKYTDLQGATYSSYIEASLAELANEQYNRFTMKVTNNSATTPVKVRIDIMSTQKVNETLASNVSATQDGTGVTTDTTNGGSMFEIAAGETATLVVDYDATRGLDRLLVYVDTHVWGDTEKHSGDVTFSGMLFEKIGGGDEEPENPSEPEDNDNKLKVNWINESIASNLVANDEVDAFTLLYNGSGPNYGACASFKPAADVAGKNTFTIKIKNNNTDWSSSSHVRVELKDASGAIIQTAYVAENTWYDDDAQGVLAQIGGNQEAVLTITFDATKTLSEIIISPALSTDATISADLTFSGFTFATVEEIPQIPTQSLSFWVGEGATGYTVTPKDTATESVNVAYVGQDQDFKTMGTWAKDYLDNNNTFSVTIKNNKDTAVKIRCDIQGDQVLYATAASGNDSVYMNNGETYMTIQGGQTETLVITYTEGGAKEIIMFVGCCGPIDNNGGVVNNADADVTLSEFKFYTVE